jgi:glycosyltransferase involved in cell wall biosynthesis
MRASSVNITIPVFNETKRLRRCVPRLLLFLTRQKRFAYEIVIADNGSSDGTLAVAEELARQYPTVRVIHLEAKGRELALIETRILG